MARGIVNLEVTTTQQGLKDRYEKMLNNVANMLDKNGPIYSTWIYFQIGLDDNNYIVFDTSSQDKQQNLIASLSIEKSSSAVSNNFTLVVQYDPFNFGQTSTDAIEKLDEFIAKAMSEDFNNTTTACRGRIQYGYNSTSTVSDADLVSPLYTFFLTNASSSVNFDSGISTYTFTGVSTISIDCDFVTEFDKIENKNLLETVGRILYKYYGNPNTKPANFDVSDITPMSGEIQYNIDISAKDIEQAVTISKEKTSATMSPWVYCKNLLDENPLTDEQSKSEQFANLDEISLNKRPRYSMYVTDVDGQQTIHIVHISPASIIDENGNEVVYVAQNDDGALSIDYTFSWGMKNENLQNKNIVTGWKPEVNLHTYLIRKANHIRFKKIKELYEENPDNEEYRKAYNLLAGEFSSDVVEMYNAELELIGIPADPPMAAEIEIVPRILENVSRTAGIYKITGASDEISNTGVFKSTLKLFRVRSEKVDKYSSLTVNDTAAMTNALKLQEKIQSYRTPDTGATPFQTIVNLSEGIRNSGGRTVVLVFNLMEVIHASNK